MSTVAIVRARVEAVLAGRIPSALTHSPRIIRSVVATGIPSIDELLEGGVPSGAITELVGPECSGRTALALSYIACITQAAKVCAWIDVSNTFHPESASVVGVDLSRILLVRCGVPTETQQLPKHDFVLPEKYLVPTPAKKGLHGGGFGPHPRGEVKGLSTAVGDFLKPERMASRCAKPERNIRQEHFEPRTSQQSNQMARAISRKPWSKIEQAVRVTDLLLQAGVFSAIVLDMGSIALEYASRVPRATWFRYRAAAERTQASILLLTQHACAKSSAGHVLRMQHTEAKRGEDRLDALLARLRLFAIGN